MAYKIKKIGEKKEHESESSYLTIEDAKEFALQNLEYYKNGFKIIDTKDGKDKIVYIDERKEISRIDLIDWD